LFPVQASTTNPYNSLYRQLITYFKFQLDKGNTYETITHEVLKYSLDINETLSNKLNDFLKKDEVKQKLLENTKKGTNFINNCISGGYSISNNSIQNSNIYIKIDNKKINVGSSLLENLGSRVGI
jgi:hypothetical protein